MDVDVFITNYIYVDPDIFGFWLDGLTTWESPLNALTSNFVKYYF